MDLFLRAIIILALVPCITALYEVKNNKGDVCMLIDANFSVSVTARKNGAVVKQKTLDEFPMNRGSCGNTSAILLLNTTSGKDTVFRFQFKKVGTVGTVRMTYSFSFYASDLFPDLSDLKDFTYKAFASVPLKYGYWTYSYKCTTQQIVRLAQDPDAKDVGTKKDAYTFSVSLTMRKVQAQAFSMQDGRFSRPLYCPRYRPKPSAGIVVLIVVGCVLPFVLAAVVVVVVLRRNRAKSGRSGVL